MYSRRGTRAGGQLCEGRSSMESESKSMALPCGWQCLWRKVFIQGPPHGELTQTSSDDKWDDAAGGCASPVLVY